MKTCICLVIVALTVTAQAADDKFSAKLDHKTLYISSAIAGAHRFELQGTIAGDGGTGTLVIDKIPCELNWFGDRSVCALPGPKPLSVPVTFVRIPLLRDPAMLDRRTYHITGTGLPEELRFAVALDEKPTQPYLRLIVEDRSHHPPETGYQSAFPLVPGDEYDLE